MIVWLFLWLNICVRCCCSGLSNEHFKTQDNMFMANHVYRTSTSQSLIHCAAKCHASTECLSFSFDREQHECHLNNNNSDTANIQPRASFIYGRRIEETPEFPGCGYPPEVASASISYNGDHLAAEARYTCYANYMNCLARSISQCQSNGQWEDMSGLCERRKWINPSTETQRYLPCGLTGGFNVRISGTPNNGGAGRMTFQIHNSAITFVQMDIRFNYFGFTGIYIYDCIDDVWSPETTMTTFPFAIGVPFLVIISEDSGMFSFSVQGEFLPGYPRLFTPKYVNFINDVSLSEVEITV